MLRSRVRIRCRFAAAAAAAAAAATGAMRKLPTDVQWESFPPTHTIDDSFSNIYFPSGSVGNLVSLLTAMLRVRISPE